jgi:hypothetical protein
MNDQSQGTVYAAVDPKSPEQAVQDLRALVSSALVTAVIAVAALWGSFAILG